MAEHISNIELTESGISEGSNEAVAYRPSFIDGITDWVRGLPVSPPFFYAGLGAFSLLLYLSVKWLDGSVAPGEIYPVHVVSALGFVYALGLLHYLDSWAGKTFDEFRATMCVSDGEFRELRFRLTTLPLWPTLVAFGIGAVFVFMLLLTFTPEDVRQYKLFTSPVSTALDVLFPVLNYGIGNVLFYHSVRQLRLMNRIYVTHAEVNLFKLGPIYALARLTARTSIGLILFTNAWVTANILVSGEQKYLNVVLVATVIQSLVAVAVFVLPLLGAHRLISNEKQRMEELASEHMKAAIAELHTLKEAGKLNEMGRMRDTLEVIQKEQDVLSKISTWPWQPETLRGFASAIVLPVLIWGIIRVLGQIFGT